MNFKRITMAEALSVNLTTNVSCQLNQLGFLSVVRNYFGHLSLVS